MPWPPRQPSAAVPPDDRAPGGFERTFQMIGLVAAPLTLITALLFYVGWVRTQYLFGHFGIDPALVGLSNQDYLLRSVDGIYAPAGLLLGLGLLGLWTHGLVRRLLVEAGRRHRVAALGTAVSTVGAIGFLIGAVALASPLSVPVQPLFAALLLGGGCIAVGYGRWLLRCLPGMRRRPVELPGRRPVELTLLSLLVVLSLFWAATEFAAAVGRGRAQAFASGLAARPGVVVYSAQRLFLTGPNILEEVLSDQPTAAYHYRYSGLRLLSESPSRLFLLPTAWTPGTATLVVDYGAGVRVDLTPGAGA